jgi:hypothetical protein
MVKACNIYLDKATTFILLVLLLEVQLSSMKSIDQVTVDTDVLFIVLLG